MPSKPFFTIFAHPAHLWRIEQSGKNLPNSNLCSLKGKNINLNYHFYERPGAHKKFYSHSAGAHSRSSAEKLADAAYTTYNCCVHGNNMHASWLSLHSFGLVCALVCWIKWNRSRQCRMSQYRSSSLIEFMSISSRWNRS